MAWDSVPPREATKEFDSFLSSRGFPDQSTSACSYVCVAASTRLLKISV